MDITNIIWTQVAPVIGDSFGGRSPAEVVSLIGVGVLSLAVVSSVFRWAKASFFGRR